MLNAQESEELQQLRARAYGPGGGMESDRLAQQRLLELEAIANGSAPEVDTMPVDGPVERSVSEEASSSRATPSAHGAGRAVPVLVAVAGAVLLAVGAFLGGFAFGQHEDDPVSPTAFREGYPPSVRESYERVAPSLDWDDPYQISLASEGEAGTIWVGTAGGHAYQCSVLDHGGGKVETQCTSAVADDDDPVRFTWPDSLADEGSGATTVTIGKNGQVSASWTQTLPE
ncbi:hypothetical protein GCM10022219_06650 [Microbacterium oryzae]|uniref:Uncharacterized protein n=1 Tax=Microbacterium oryzae TaxID=743009 RepID=A0A6I6E203_9MICO|nr:hypothetical protein [Microbacterium oryzae]QGU26767.1 hypothetical protein D7D94_03110 [Microbacterium oryzae]